MDSPHFFLSPRLQTIPTLLATVLVACTGPAGSGARAAPTAAEPPSFAYAPYTARYQGVARGHVEQEVNGRWTANDFHLRYELSVRIDSVDGSLLATLVIDSVPEVGGVGFAAAQAARARGATFTATLASDGALLEFRPASPISVGPVEDAVTRALQDFFPRLPGALVLPGAEWDDTLETTTTLGGIEIARVARRRHVASNWTLDGTGRTLTVATLSNYELEGSGEQSGREFTLVGSGQRHILQRLADDGRYLGSVATDTSEATVELDVGVFIPIRQTRVDSVSIAT